MRTLCRTSIWSKQHLNLDNASIDTFMYEYDSSITTVLTWCKSRSIPECVPSPGWEHSHTQREADTLVTSTAPLLLVTELEMVCVRDIANATLDKHHLKGAFSALNYQLIKWVFSHMVCTLCKAATIYSTLSDMCIDTGFNVLMDLIHHMIVNCGDVLQ